MVLKLFRYRTRCCKRLAFFVKLKGLLSPYRFLRFVIFAKIKKVNKNIMA